MGVGGGERGNQALRPSRYLYIEEYGTRNPVERHASQTAAVRLAASPTGQKSLRVGHRGGNSLIIEFPLRVIKLSLDFPL